MRSLVRAAALLALAFGCSPVTMDNRQADIEVLPDELESDPGYPTGYEEWTKLNTAPIVHKDDGEARNLYANAKAKGSRKGPFPAGSVLVKAQAHLDNQGRPGPLFRLSVMTKGTGKANGGWEFATFDAETRKSEQIETEVCTICHAQRADSDFVFTDRSKF